MPFARVTTHPALNTSVSAALAEEVTAHLAKLMGKKAALTSVLVEPAAGKWFIGGHEVPRSSHFEVAVTAGTNTAQQIEQFISAAHASLVRHCGTLPEASYVVVRELPATSWGYNGMSQAARRNKLA